MASESFKYSVILDPLSIRALSTKTSSKIRPPRNGSLIVIRSHPPIYKLQGRKKTLTVHHDRLKPHNSSFPLWLQMKRRFLLDILLIDEGEDGDDLGEPEPSFVLDLDTYFDPDATLSYMQGMDLNATHLYMPADQTDSSVLLDIGNGILLMIVCRMTLVLDIGNGIILCQK